MKILSLAAAALVALTGVAAAAPAAAAPVPQERVVVRERVVAPRTTRVVVRERSSYHRDSGRHYGWRNRPRRVCTVRYRHGERIRTCRYRRY